MHGLVTVRATSRRCRDYNNTDDPWASYREGYGWDRRRWRRSSPRKRIAYKLADKVYEGRRRIFSASTNRFDHAWYCGRFLS
jgi:hypothetical protein